MKLYYVRTEILGPARKARSAVIEGCLVWHVDHPSYSMNTPSHNGDDFWNDPYPERELAYNVVDRYFEHPFLRVNSPAIVLNILPLLQTALKDYFGR